MARHVDVPQAQRAGGQRHRQSPRVPVLGKDGRILGLRAHRAVTAPHAPLLARAADEEIKRLSRYVREMTVYHRDVEPQPDDYPTSIVRSLVEEFSGQAFDYHEILPAWENCQYDARARDVSPRTRALADLCLLLFNTNEFLYVD